MDQANMLHAASAEANGTLVRAVDKASAGVHDRLDQVFDVARPP